MAVVPVLVPPVPVARGGSGTRVRGRVRRCQPRVDEHVLRGQALGRVLAQQAADEALTARGQALGKVKVAAADLGEETGVLLTVEGIPKERKEPIVMVATTNASFGEKFSHHNLLPGKFL